MRDILKKLTLRDYKQVVNSDELGRHIAEQIDSLTARAMEELNNAVALKLDPVVGSLNEVKGSLDNLSGSVMGSFDEVNGSLENLKDSLNVRTTQLDGAIAALIAQTSSVESNRKLNARLLTFRYHLKWLEDRRRVLAQEDKPPRQAEATDLAAQFAQLEKMFPRVFPIWKSLFDAGAEEYLRRPVANLSLEGHPEAEAFRKFVYAYAEGHVLDIGCGPQPLPIYLRGLPLKRVAGIDPLPGTGKREFEFVQSVCEFLPWPDAEFDTVIVATSLDHVFSLDIALAEIKRVMSLHGVLLLWMGFVPGAQPYDLNAPNLQPIDEHHLFHFDRPWFLELIRQHFDLIEEVDWDGVSHFYALVKK